MLPQSHGQVASVAVCVYWNVPIACIAGQLPPSLVATAGAVGVAGCCGRGWLLWVGLAATAWGDICAC